MEGNGGAGVSLHILFHYLPSRTSVLFHFMPLGSDQETYNWSLCFTISLSCFALLSSLLNLFAIQCYCFVHRITNIDQGCDVCALFQAILY